MQKRARWEVEDDPVPRPRGAVAQASSRASRAVPVITDCGHKFHQGCIKTWFSQCRANERPKTCPNCRGLVRAITPIQDSNVECSICSPIADQAAPPSSSSGGRGKKKHRTRGTRGTRYGRNHKTKKPRTRKNTHRH